MSDIWINSNNRLDNAVGKLKADEIRMERLLKPENVKKKLVKIEKDGNLKESLIDRVGKVIK